MSTTVRRIAHHWGEDEFTLIHGVLSRCYWCEGIPRALLARAMQGSLNFLLFNGLPTGEDALVGYARVISDRATFAYLCDVFVLEDWRGRGLGDWLISQVVAHPELQGLRRFNLVTRDAHSLYARHGFTALGAPERGMEIVRPGLYLNLKE